jgi:hypothetical protein
MAKSWVKLCQLVNSRRKYLGFCEEIDKVETLGLADIDRHKATRSIDAGI